MPEIDGMGPNAETYENENGGKQSKVPARFDLMDSPSLFNMGQILQEGAEKYGIDNWRNISVDEHLNHAVAHIRAYWSGDRQEDHIGHAQCRVHMAKAIQIENKSDHVKNKFKIGEEVLLDYGGGYGVYSEIIDWKYSPKTGYEYRFWYSRGN